MIWRGLPTVYCSTTIFLVVAMFLVGGTRTHPARLVSAEISTLVGRLDLHQAWFLASVHTGSRADQCISDESGLALVQSLCWGWGCACRTLFLFTRSAQLQIHVACDSICASASSGLMCVKRRQVRSPPQGQASASLVRPRVLIDAAAQVPHFLQRRGGLCNPKRVTTTRSYANLPS